ncbi:LPS assembly lipoprotein LptE [Pleomorphomonas sp. NRK KF1]|uniref:LPS assembly lipoprotein LptE n=1 Tax=Pleomorphomonas sp. NRK KF1 TaxID=2943000 RepID=UPI00204436FF|nr:LPS assembly lipoprotein LptE [Pleomorphomonas sp. NRK KF1]MCM5554770.1 LPS assembly lipoprotein LptE [Pleomorphomonas sp. NRK KF1]
MWSSDLFRRGVLLLAAAGFLAACQVRPVYAPAGSAVAGNNPAMVTELASIAIKGQTERVAQALINELIFQLRGGGALVEPKYRLDLILTTRVSDLAIRAREDIPVAKLVSLTATYTLTEVATSRVVTSDNVYATSSFDVSSQRYANVRAQRDAEDRAARAAAADIRLRLSSALIGKG